MSWKRLNTIRTLVRAVAAACVAGALGFATLSKGRAESPVTAIHAATSEAGQGPGGSEGDKLPSVARAVAQDAGKSVRVQGRSGEDAKPWLAVFQETHTSRLGQVEVALMLYRLYRDHAMRDVALEGYLKGTTVNATWFHRHQADVGVRKRVALQLLEAGEVSAAEFIALVFPQVKLHPIEDPKLHAVEMGEGAGKKVIGCIQQLVKTAAAKDEHQQELRRLAPSERENYMLTKAEPAVGRLIEIFKSQKTGTVTQAEEWVKTLAAVEERAVAPGSGVNAEDLEGVREMKRFFETAHDRSEIMAGAAADVEARPDAVTAMIIGAAHTTGVCAQLDERKRRYALFSPRSLAKGENKTDLPGELFKRQGKKLPIDVTGLGGLLAGGRKSPPVLMEEWFQINADLRAALDRIASAAGTPPLRKPPFGLNVEDLNTPLMRIDAASIEVIDGEVLLKIVVWPSDHEKRKELWARARAVDRPSADADEDLERTLKALLSKFANERVQALNAAAPAAPTTTPVFNATSKVEVFLSVDEKLAKATSVAQRI